MPPKKSTPSRSTAGKAPAAKKPPTAAKKPPAAAKNLPTGTGDTAYDQIIVSSDDDDNSQDDMYNAAGKTPAAAKKKSAAAKKNVKKTPALHKRHAAAKKAAAAMKAAAKKDADADEEDEDDTISDPLGFLPKIISVATRNQGNECYKRALRPGLAPVIVDARLNAALQLYEKAHSTSTGNDKAACLKNIGMVHYQCLKREMEENSTKEIPVFLKIHHHVILALTSFSEASTMAWNSQPLVWHKHIAITCVVIAHLVSQHFKNILKEFRQRIPQLEKIIYHPRIRTVIPCVRAFMCKLVVDMYFKEAVTAKTSKDFRFGLQNLAEANRPFIEGSQASNRMYLDEYWMTDVQREEDWGYEMSNLKSQFIVLEEELITEKCALESMQNIFLGDQFHDLAISSTDGLIIAYTYDAMDCYRAAIVSSQVNNDIELEGKACSLLARIYTDILKRPSKGKELFKQAIQCGFSLEPAVNHNEPWFKAANEAVEKFQKVFDQSIEDNWTVEKEPFKDEMADVLTAISNSRNIGIAAFLGFIYTTHPPKPERVNNEKHPVPEQFSENHKSLLKHGLIHYHFDINRATYKDVKWTMICEEISKNLSSLRQAFK